MTCMLVKLCREVPPGKDVIIGCRHCASDKLAGPRAILHHLSGVLMFAHYVQQLPLTWQPDLVYSSERPYWANDLQDTSLDVQT